MVSWTIGNRFPSWAGDCTFSGVSIPRTRRAQSSEAFNRCNGKAFLVIVKIDVLRYPSPLNHLANINP
jgi:hypothetical protein